MSEWQEYKLEEITEPVKDGYTPSADDLRPYIGLEHIEQEKLRLNSVGLSSEVTSNKFAFQCGDVLFGKLRPYFRKVYRPKFSGVCSTDIWVFRPKGDFDQSWLFYFLADWGFVDTANGGDGGTRMPRADWNFLKATLWQVPSPAEQEAIAAVLSSLDDKIDLLHRQNATLEALAETLFRQWFEIEATDVWQEGRLGDVVEIFDNKRIPLSNLEREKMKDGFLYPYYGAAQIMDYVNQYIFDGEYILLGEDGTVRTDEGYPVLQYATGKFWVNNHTHVLRAKAPYSNFLIWCLLKKRKIDEIVTGAVQPKINQGNLLSLTLPNFPDNLISQFNHVTAPVFEKIKRNRGSVLDLEKLRDTLLPKLMSGEVRVAV